MANQFINAGRIVSTSLGVLEREVILPNLVWRNAAGDFRGARNDTVSLRLPAFTNARTRTLRSNTGLTFDELSETVVDLKLRDQIYKGVAVTLEELTLDVEDFERQVAVPATNSVARGIEDGLAVTMDGADYEVEIDLDEDDPYLGLVDARTALGLANVPAGGRFLAVGSSVEAAILKSDRLSKFDSTGDSSNAALREATIGRIAGFTAVSIPALDPNVAIASHQTGFALELLAPSVPQGAVVGATRAYRGFSLTVIQDYDHVAQKDRFSASVFAGSAAVKDKGTINASGRFVPDDTPTEEDDDSGILVRAVKLSLPGASS